MKKGAIEAQVADVGSVPTGLPCFDTVYWDIFARANERSCMRGVLWFGRGLFILERRSCFDFERWARHG